MLLLKNKCFQTSLWLIVFCCFSIKTTAQNNYFYPNTGSFDPKVPSPEQFLGYPIGSHFTRHDMIVAYFKELARVSDKVHVQTIGKTYEERPQIVATITTPENYARLETIRQNHLATIDPSKNTPLSNSATEPVIILLGYSVHGNETSSGEAAMLNAYYLTANTSDETQKWLRESVVFVDPALNPDGRDRAANWHNSYKSFPNTTDPIDKEHIEIWPNGRTNHYLSNLNRDWLSATQVESQNRLAFFHQWYPNIQVDFHEMGANSTYYFEPTPKRTQSPIIPQSSYDFNTVLASKYHVHALDKIGSLYFTKEQYDNISPIYGGTYGDFYGGVAMTFEEASTRGFEQESDNGVLTFPYTIRNHTVMGIATVRGAVAERAGLQNLQKTFFQKAIERAKAQPTKAFVFGDSRDRSLTQHFLEVVLRHNINVYPLQADATIDGRRFESGKAFVVPVDQPGYYIIHSIFEETPPLTDSLYYDNTSWSLIHASGLQYAKITDLGKINRGEAVKTADILRGSIDGNRAEYAYLLNWTEYNAPRALYHLLDKGVLVKSAFKPFTTKTASGKSATFGYGSLVIPVARQTISPDSLQKVVQSAAELAKVTFMAVSTGFNTEGVDLGSANIRTVRKPTIGMVVGAGTNFEEVGQTWFLMNQHLNAPISKIDISNFSKANLNRYNTLIFVSGSYAALDKNTVARLKLWISEGGTLITFKNAAEWAIQQDLIRERVYSDSLEKKEMERVDFSKQEETESPRRINGGIFSADIDISNPIAFGISERRIVFTKNSTTILLPSRNKYATVAKYDATPYISGYVSKANINRIKNTAAILVGQEGAGKIILFADDPSYRSYWHGTDRLLMNAIFFGNLVNMN